MPRCPCPPLSQGKRLPTEFTGKQFSDIPFPTHVRLIRIRTWSVVRHTVSTHLIKGNNALALHARHKHGRHPSRWIHPSRHALRPQRTTPHRVLLFQPTLRPHPDA